METLLKKLTELFYIKDDEKAANIICKELSKYCESKIDKNGNIIGELGCKTAQKHIMFEAHIDQIGLIVTNVLDNGFVKIAPCGGINPKILPGSLVKIYGKEVFTGIICSNPPHLSSEKENKYPKIEELYVDTALSTEEAQDKIPLYSFVGFAQKPTTLLNNRVAAPAIDNRASVASLLACAKKLAKEELTCKVSFVFSVSEETTGAGAKTASFEVFPQEAIVVDVSFATQPHVPHENKGILGAGPMIGFAPSLSKETSQKLVKIAKKNNIPYQHEVMSGKTGTNADSVAITKTGIKTGLVSIPIRNMHSAVELVDISDIKNTAKLLALYTKTFENTNI